MRTDTMSNLGEIRGIFPFERVLFAGIRIKTPERRLCGWYDSVTAGRQQTGASVHLCGS